VDAVTGVGQSQTPPPGTPPRQPAGAAAVVRAQQSAASAVPAPAPGPHRLFLWLLPIVIAVAVTAIDLLTGPNVELLPVLAVAPALAAISWLPSGTAVMGVAALAAGAGLMDYDGYLGSPGAVTDLFAIAGVTAAGVVASAVRRSRERELADVLAVAEAAQQILLRPVPGRIPPVGVAVRYVSAAASARIGGDLYEAVAADGCVRLIVGDVLGKGLPAARTAAVVLGAFRETAYDAADLPQIAARIEASLRHQEAAEEFVTAVLAQVSGDGSQVEILNCGHPEPLVVRRGAVTVAESPRTGLPLGLGSLADSPRDVSVVEFRPGDRILFYTDGISEARDGQGDFYPLEQSGPLLGPAGAGAADLGTADLGTALDTLIADVLRHVGHSLRDDAAMLLISRD
jgi:serine phosphatase RsbU (regulator of sigma subunit)